MCIIGKQITAIIAMVGTSNAEITMAILDLFISLRFSFLASISLTVSTSVTTRATTAIAANMHDGRYAVSVCIPPKNFNQHLITNNTKIIDY